MASYTLLRGRIAQSKQQKHSMFFSRRKVLKLMNAPTLIILLQMGSKSNLQNRNGNEFMRHLNQIVMAHLIQIFHTENKATLTKARKELTANHTELRINTDQSKQQKHSILSSQTQVLKLMNVPTLIFLLGTESKSNLRNRWKERNESEKSPPKTLKLQNRVQMSPDARLNLKRE